MSAVIVPQEPAQKLEDLVFAALMEPSPALEVFALLVKQVINPTLIKLIVFSVLRELSHLMDLLVFLVYKVQSPLQKVRLFVFSAQLATLPMQLELHV